MPLTTEVAHRMIAASEAKARELGTAMSTAIFDAEGRLFSFSRMNGSPWKSVEIAQAKAFTGALMGRDGPELQKTDSAVIASMSVMFGRALSVSESVTTVREDGVVIAAIGCSGGSHVEDGACAHAARDAFSS